MKQITLPFLSVAALLMMVTMLIRPVTTLAQTSSALAEIISVQGSVEVRHKNSWTKAAAKKLLYQGDVVQTGEDGLVKILSNDESRILVNKNSTFVIRDVAPAAGWVKVQLGKIRRSLYQLYPAKEGQTGEVSFEINNRNIEVDLETPTIKAGIRGTSLVLRVQPHSLRSGSSLPTSILTVVEGQVEAQGLTGPQDTVSATTGSRVVAEEGKALQLERLTISPTDAVQWSLYVPPMLYATADPSTQSKSPQLAAAEQQAYKEMQSGNLSGAIEQLKKLNRTHPQESAPYRLLAIALLRVNQNDAAHSAAQQAVAKAPDSPAAAVVLSYTYQSLFDLPMAKRETQRALSLDPQNVVALTNLARLQFGEDNISGAWETLQHAGRLAPEDGEVFNLLGFVLLAQRNTEAAITHFEQAINFNSRLGEPHLGLCLAYMRQGRSEEAFKEMATAVLLDPHRSSFYSYWGKILSQVGRFDKALSALQHAQTLDPQDPTPEFYRAIILRDLNRPGEAIRAFNRAIELNDNRAVYRSRFLLDQDLAVRNINLGNLYNELGLNAWARNKALASIKYDYTNFDGHLFYAGALNELDGRSYSFTSEALLARFMQPANINTFNNFNNYTVFFEQPKAQGTLTGEIGNNATYGGSAELVGALPDINTAFNLGGFYQETDGWRDSNHERFASGVAIAKWQPTLADGFLATISLTKPDQGDALYPRFEYDAPAQPDDNFEGQVQRYELGYHRHIAPRSDLFLYATYLHNDTDLFQKQRITELPDGTIVDAERFIDADRPFFQGQLHYTFSIQNHQLLLGTLQYWGDSEASDTTDLLLSTAEQSQRIPFTDLENKLDLRYESYYLQDMWQVNHWLSTEIATYYDRIENGNVFNSTEWVVEHFNPRFGLIVTPTTRDTLRLAAFRYILPFIAPRLDPTDVAGLPVFRNSLEGSENTEYAIAWDHEWQNGFTSFNIFHLDKDSTDKIIVQEQEVERQLSGQADGVELEHNQLLTDEIGLVGSYRYLKVDDDVDPLQGTLSNVNRNEHLFKLGLRYVRANGVFAGVGQTVRCIDNKNTRPYETAAITDLEVGYRFPEKRGVASLKVMNMFDNNFNWVTDRLVLQGRQPAREVLFTLSLNF